MKLTVQPGDTLTHLTREALKKGAQLEPGADLSFSSLFNRIQTVAKTNQIANPDLIHPGQVIDFAPIMGRKHAAAVATVGSSETPSSRPGAIRTHAVAEATEHESSHRVLERTLERAVAKGYLPQADLPEARRRILDMAKEHRFMPDDFARVALIESDGFNPRATNGNCHGVIQFCDGPDRGAASVGFGAEPKKILSMSVVDQLELVDKYFGDTQLKSYMPASLDALYLTVLYPAARDERQMHTALPIPGPQASVLHVGGVNRNPITRASIRKGLMENASLRLNQFALEKARNDLAATKLRESQPLQAQQAQQVSSSAQVLAELHASNLVSSHFPATQFFGAINRPAAADVFAARERM
jgi:hypothetical protein